MKEEKIGLYGNCFKYEDIPCDSEIGMYDILELNDLLLTCVQVNPLTFRIVSNNPHAFFYKEAINRHNLKFKNRSKKMSEGIKESEGKLNYELDFEFITQMAEKMSLNKGKYAPYNWKNPINIELLKQSLFRHVVEVMKGNMEDDGRTTGHLESIALNAMMINYQIMKNEN